MRGTWLGLAVLLFSGHVALAGLGDVAGAARPAERGISDCGKQFSSKQLIDCIAGHLDGFGSDLARAAGRKAPAASSAVAAAAANLRAAPNKAAAVSALNRAQSVMQGLAAKSSGETKAMYTRVNRAYARALNVINKKG